MAFSWNISKEAETALRATWGDDLDRAAFEALLIEGYRTGKHSSADIGHLLALPDRGRLSVG